MKILSSVANNKDVTSKEYVDGKIPTTTSVLTNGGDGDGDYYAYSETSATSINYDYSTNTATIFDKDNSTEPFEIASVDDIPTVNNGKLTFYKDNAKLTDFTANSSTNVNVDLTNSVKDVQINGTSILSSGNADIKTYGTYNASTNKIATMSDLPTVPTKTSDLTNDSGFITDSKVVVINYGDSISFRTIETYVQGNYVVICKYVESAQSIDPYNTKYLTLTNEQGMSKGSRTFKFSGFINSSGRYRVITFLENQTSEANGIWSYIDIDLQEELVSGTNIKTINNTSLLGSGDISFETIQDISGDINIKNLATGIYRIYGGVYGCDVYYNSTGSLSVPSMAYSYLIVTEFPDIYTIKSWTFRGNSSEFYYGECWETNGYCYSVTSEEAQETITGILSNLTTTSKTNLVSAINELDSDKQDALVSGTNIKTINNQSILGSGNINISGGATKTIMQAVKTSDTTSYSTSYNYFSPFNGDGNASATISIGSGLTFETKTVAFGDRTSQSVYGITVGTGISIIKVYYSTRYLNNHTANVGINSNIYRVRNNTADIMYGTTTTMPTNTRTTLTGEHYIEVQEGDFIFIGGYRTLKTSDVDVISTNNATSMYVEVIQ